MSNKRKVTAFEHVFDMRIAELTGKECESIPMTESEEMEHKRADIERQLNRLIKTPNGTARLSDLIQREAKAGAA